MVGVAYFFCLAWQLLTADVETKLEAPDVSTLVRREFLTLMGEPKACLPLTAFLPQFVNDIAPLMPQLFALGALYLLVEGVAALQQHMRCDCKKMLRQRRPKMNDG